MPGLYIGLMSGTSLDGIDAVLADFGAVHPRVVAHHHDSFPATLRAELAELNSTGTDELRRAALAGNELANCYARCVAEVIGHSGLAVADVMAIGCHGQTVRHQPAAGYTIQLVNAALLAELTHLTVVNDFRSRDVAAGGEGAPLVPAFHAGVFGTPDEHRVVVNIGGIANLTDLPPAGPVTGFDCGPGNLLLDGWVQKHLGTSFDRDGEWARSGRSISTLLGRLAADEYFRLRPPKSTGRETFNMHWVTGHLNGSENPADVQATLLELTARGIADAILKFSSDANSIYLCGGGARNVALVQRLSELLAPRNVDATDKLGVDAEHVEALAFAWLAHQTLEGKTGNLPSVTGARGPRILGAIHPA